MENDRLKKVESVIQREIARLITEKEIKDPRVHSMLSVNRVVVSKDIAYAKVYISAFEKENRLDEAVDALNHASGFVQKQLGKKLKTRNTPKLTFIADTSVKEGFRINKLIEDSLS
ncbi:MAG: 30S ribosome-binding factor RbfA [Spirochaetia bacterium]